MITFPAHRTLTQRAPSSPSPRQPRTASPSPAARSRQPPSPSLLTVALRQLQLYYYRYEVTFSLYVMTPGEKFVINAFVLLVLTLAAVAVTCYLPRVALGAAERLVWLLCGVDGRGVARAVWNAANQALGGALKVLDAGAIDERAAATNLAVGATQAVEGFL